MPLSKLMNRDFKPPDLDTLDEVTYCINCVDQISGRVGSFVCDASMFEKTGTHWAIGPVCLTVDALFDYLREKGFEEYSATSMFTVRRKR